MKVRVVFFLIGLIAGLLVVLVEIGSHALTPSLAIPYLALVDGLLLFVLALEGASLVLSQRVAAKAQGIITLIVSLLWVLGSLSLALLAVRRLLVPSLGLFPVGASMAVLGVILLLKLIWAAGLLLANHQFMHVKSLVIFFLLSVLLQVVLGFLYGLLPEPIVGIGDAFWAVITAAVALVWAVITLIASIPAIIKAVHSSGRIA